MVKLYENLPGQIYTSSCWWARNLFWENFDKATTSTTEMEIKSTRYYDFGDSDEAKLRKNTTS
jgi:hypothetical protein